MSIRSVRVKDYSEGKEYVYGDMTGSWDSIDIVSYVLPYPFSLGNY